MSKTVVSPGEYVDAKAGRTDEQAKTLSNWKIARTKLLQVVEKNTHFTWNGVGKLPNEQTYPGLIFNAHTHNTHFFRSNIKIFYTPKNRKL